MQKGIILRSALDLSLLRISESLHTPAGFVMYSVSREHENKEENIVQSCDRYFSSSSRPIDSEIRTLCWSHLLLPKKSDIVHTSFVLSVYVLTYKK